MFCSYIFFLLPDCFTYFTRLLLTTRYYLVPVGRYGLRVRIMAIEEDGMMTLRIGLKFSVYFVHIICIYICPMLLALLTAVRCSRSLFNTFSRIIVRTWCYVRRNLLQIFAVICSGRSFSSRGST